jgi:hypothetical protein
VAGLAVAALALLALSPAVARVALAQDAPDPGAGGGGPGPGLDFGPLTGLLRQLLDAITDGLGRLRTTLGQDLTGLWEQLKYLLGLLPRLAMLSVLSLPGLVAHGLIARLDLGEAGALLTKTPEGPFREAWVQGLVRDAKGAAFALLVPALALRAFTWNVGLSREELGVLLRDAFLTAVLVATIDGWFMFGLQLANGLGDAIGGGQSALPGAAAAQQLAAGATVPRRSTWPPRRARTRRRRSERPGTRSRRRWRRPPSTGSWP